MGYNFLNLFLYIFLCLSFSREAIGGRLVVLYSTLMSEVQVIYSLFHQDICASRDVRCRLPDESEQGMTFGLPQLGDETALTSLKPLISASYSGASKPKKG